MKIEPCPLCGCPCGISDDDVVSCTNCSYRYDSDCALEVHNRLSRIVRAAEEYVMAREAIPGQVFAEFGDDSVSFPAYEELRGAVEGGAEA